MKNERQLTFNNYKKPPGENTYSMNQSNKLASEEIKKLLKDLSDISKKLHQVSQTPIGKVEEFKDLDRSSKILSSLNSIPDIKNRLDELTLALKKERIDQLNPEVQKFIEDLRKKGERTKEVARGWRIGKITFESRTSPRAQFRFTYNNEPIQDWINFSTQKDLDLNYGATLKQLSAYEIPSNNLGEIFYNAYLTCKENYNPHQQVKIVDLYQPLRKTLLIDELETKKTRILSKFIDFPRCAFLYNLDRYRQHNQVIDRSVRLTVQTGSQQETTQFGVVLNGLSNTELQKYCWIGKE